MELTQIQKAFGARLCLAMQAKNLSQTKLAGLTKISKSHIGRMMKGEINVCLDSIRKLAEHCDVEPKFFFDWE